MRVALDTNVLVYAEGVNADARREAAEALVQALPPDATVVPVQVLGELYNVLVRKGRRTPEAARFAISKWRNYFDTADTSVTTVTTAAELAATHRLSIWDAVVLAAASEAGCRLLLSEDMQDGFEWRGVTVANPFAATRHPALVALLAPG